MGICLSSKSKEIINIELHDKLISEINPDEYKYFTWKGQTFDAKPCNIYDGDTFSVCFYYYGQVIKYRCRCLGYDSPEMKPSLKLENRLEIKKNAVKAKNRLAELLSQNNIIRITCGDFDKYGRVLVTMYNDVNGSKSINDIMLEEGYGYKYNGGTKQV